MSDEKIIKMSISQLERLLTQQKEQVAYDLLAFGTGRYASQNNEDHPDYRAGHHFSLDIDKEKFKKAAMKSNFPEEFSCLKKYL